MHPENGVGSCTVYVDLQLFGFLVSITQQKKGRLLVFPAYDLYCSGPSYCSRYPLLGNSLRSLVFKFCSKDSAKTLIHCADLSNSIRIYKFLSAP